MEAKLQQQMPQKAQASKPNLTGIPTQMKLDFEQRSGLSFDDVRVHYNSDKPAQLQALAYTQGTQVYVGPGQERHLKHELGHVVQQKQGLVTPTKSVAGYLINDSRELEQLADRHDLRKIKAVKMPMYTVQAVIQREPKPPLPSLSDIAIRRLGELLNGQRLVLYALLSPERLIQIGLPADLVHEISNIVADLENTHPNLINSDKNSTSKTLQLLIKRKISDYYRITEMNPNNQIGRYIGLFDDYRRTNCLSFILREVLLPIIITNEQRSTVDTALPFTLTTDNMLTGPAITAINLNPSVANWNKEIVAGTERFNRLVQVPLPRISISRTWFGGVTYANNMCDDSQPFVPTRTGYEEYGIAAGIPQVVHEHGHHLENNLGVDDFVRLHNFLRLRTTPGDSVRRVGWGKNQWGYNAVLPSMSFQTIGQYLPTCHSVPLYYIANVGNYALSQVCRFLAFSSSMSVNWREFIDDFFLQDSNSMTTSYATLFDPENYSTEFLSTTVELLSTYRGAMEVINTDPFRVAMFLYLANRPLYERVASAYRNRQGEDLSIFLGIT